MKTALTILYRASVLALGLERQLHQYDTAEIPPRLPRRRLCDEFAREAAEPVDLLAVRALRRYEEGLHFDDVIVQVLVYRATELARETKQRQGARRDRECHASACCPQRGSSGKPEFSVNSS